MRNFPPERIFVSPRRQSKRCIYSVSKIGLSVLLDMQYVHQSFARRRRGSLPLHLQKLKKILSLQPDLVLSFSDLQANIAAELIKSGVAVMAYNQRDIAGILAMIRHLGAIVGVGDKANELASSYEKRLNDIQIRKNMLIDRESTSRNGTHP